MFPNFEKETFAICLLRQRELVVYNTELKPLDVMLCFFPLKWETMFLITLSKNDIINLLSITCSFYQSAANTDPFNNFQPTTNNE